MRVEIGHSWSDGEEVVEVSDIASSGGAWSDAAGGGVLAVSGTSDGSIVAKTWLDLRLSHV